tara:strand:- start:321 stop:761 length:441 start_codon:yes stop_codon:yes gene_type:complete
MEAILPGVEYTSDGTWESVVFTDPEFPRPLDEVYEDKSYKLTNVEAIKKFREERNTRLSESDRYMCPDYPHPRYLLSLKEWKEYRQALRVLTETARPTLDEDGNLKDIVWPVKVDERKIHLEFKKKNREEVLAAKLKLKEESEKKE